MTEIRVEKKERSIWPWLLLALLALAVILYFVFRDNDHDDMAVVTDDTTTTATMQAPQQDMNAVASYVAFVNGDTGRMSLDHNYSSTALTRLIDAVAYKANAAGIDVQADMDKARAAAGQIKEEPYETSHANKIRDAADIISTAIQNLQQSKYPALSSEVSSLKNAAAAIKPAELTLNQKTEVQTFFDRAAAALQKME